MRRAGCRHGRVAPRLLSVEGMSPRPCSVCGNVYDKSFEVSIAGASHVFDSFECAIHALAPVCDHCGCRIIGHGLEASGVLYCCVHCAKHEGEDRLRDRV